jgi:hypothetical protein
MPITKTIDHPEKKQLGDLTDEQSKQLIIIKEGLAIGRPHGYTFTSYGILYLLSLSVDLFGLINELELHL